MKFRRPVASDQSDLIKNKKPSPGGFVAADIIMCRFTHNDQATFQNCQDTNIGVWENVAGSGAAFFVPGMLHLR